MDVIRHAMLGLNTRLRWAVVLLAAIISLVFSLIVAQPADSAAVKGSSCANPFKDFRWIEISTNGDGKASIRFEHENVEDGTYVKWSWKPKRGYVVCKAVLRLYNQDPRVIRGPRGGSFDYTNPTGARAEKMRRLTVYTRRQL